MQRLLKYYFKLTRVYPPVNYCKNLKFYYNTGALPNEKRKVKNEKYTPRRGFAWHPFIEGIINN